MSWFKNYSSGIFDLPNKNSYSRIGGNRQLRSEPTKT